MVLFATKHRYKFAPGLLILASTLTHQTPHQSLWNGPLSSPKTKQETRIELESRPSNTRNHNIFEGLWKWKLCSLLVVFLTIIIIFIHNYDNLVPSLIFCLMWWTCSFYVFVFFQWLIMSHLPSLTLSLQLEDFKSICKV